MVPYLPPEVMTEILVKCPVKTLLKCRFVCKLWCSIISSRQFVRGHLSRCAGNTQRMILNYSDGLYDLRFYPVNDSMVLEETSINIEIADRSCFRIIGSCDGLICLKEDFSGKMLLWNPSTRESRMLPSTSGIKTFHLEWRYGFGYDCKGDDYKVLALVPQISDKDDNFSYKSIMYTLRTNSWRSIKDDAPLCTHFEDKASVFVSGAIHWKAWVQRPCIATKTSRSGVIVSFDLTSETYTEVPLPQDVGVSSALNQVGASKGCLCLLSCDINDKSNEIWVMKEYGVRVSWTKTVKIPSLNCIRLTPMTWLVENEEILLNVDKKPASYNPNKDSVRYFATNKEVRVSYPQCVGYEESLVSPNAYNNLVANETCGLNIKTGHTISKEEKLIDDKEKMKKSTNVKKTKKAQGFRVPSLLRNFCRRLAG